MDAAPSQSGRAPVPGVVFSRLPASVAAVRVRLAVTRLRRAQEAIFLSWGAVPAPNAHLPPIAAVTGRGRLWAGLPLGQVPPTRSCVEDQEYRVRGILRGPRVWEEAGLGTLTTRACCTCYSQTRVWVLLPKASHQPAPRPQRGQRDRLSGGREKTNPPYRPFSCARAALWGPCSTAAAGVPGWGDRDDVPCPQGLQGRSSKPPLAWALPPHLPHRPLLR